MNQFDLLKFVHSEYNNTNRNIEYNFAVQFHVYAAHTCTYIQLYVYKFICTFHTDIIEKCM